MKPNGRRIDLNSAQKKSQTYVSDVVAKDYAAIRAHFYGLLGGSIQPNDKEDIIQNALLNVIKYGYSYQGSYDRGFEDNRDLQVWVARIVFNKKTEFLGFRGAARLATYRSLDTSFPERNGALKDLLPTREGEPLEQIVKGESTVERKQSYLQALSCLNDRQRYIIEQTRKGFNQTEIAGQLGLNHKYSVCRSLARAKEKIRNEIGIEVTSKE